jgi:hypothetical protein
MAERDRWSDRPDTEGEAAIELDGDGGKETYGGPKKQP